ncbi:MAG: hypothetical protein CL920_29135 [Deltaproteobacteria bacterium]|nr:hypothetical protein [Deltaproteobacteria bacterium]|tara:strand:+ start:3849 stop:4667 length:819 start_codon:yes stop_codon:yes gene_type:complete
MDQVREYVFGTPTVDDKQMDVWVSFVGHYISTDYNAALRTREDSLIAYCCRGGGVLGMGAREHAFYEGDILLQPAHIPHTCRCDTETGWEVWWIIFGGQYAHKLLGLSSLHPMSPIMRVGQHERLLSCFQEVFSSLKEKGIHSQLDASRMLLVLLMELQKLHRKAHADDLQLLEHITYKTESLDQMVAESGYSKHHFIRVFKKATGMTPWSYVLHLKVDKAKELLLEKQYSVKQIACEVGMQNPLYFSRLFRKLTGVSPRQFRKDGKGIADF